jgi:leucyl-tRNA synthetase
LKELQNVPKENVWLMLKPFRSVYRAYAEHPFTKSHSGLDWDYVLAGYGTGAVMAVPCGEKEIMLLLLSLKDKTECLKSRIFFANVDISKEAYGSKDNVIINSDF